MSPPSYNPPPPPPSYGPRQPGQPEFEYCEVCGKRVQPGQIAGRCVKHGCGRKVCSECYTLVNNEIHCKYCAPPPPQVPVVETSSGGCFIATAAYGTPMADEIQVLRNFRDHSLKRTSLGQKFIALYYQTSPPIAHKIATSQMQRKIVRGLLNPIVKLFRRLEYF